jgi:ribosome assembly protein RRB1
MKRPGSDKKKKGKNRASGGGKAPPAAEDKDSLIFEDPFEDEMEEEDAEMQPEVDAEMDAEAGEEGEDADQDQAQGKVNYPCTVSTTVLLMRCVQVWKAGVDTLADDEVLDFDNKSVPYDVDPSTFSNATRLRVHRAYTMLHRTTVEWPCLSFDFVRDTLGMNRSRVFRSHCFMLFQR